MAINITFSQILSDFAQWILFTFQERTRNYFRHRLRCHFFKTKRVSSIFAEFLFSFVVTFLLIFFETVWFWFKFLTNVVEFEPEFFQTLVEFMNILSDLANCNEICSLFVEVSSIFGRIKPKIRKENVYLRDSEASCSVLFLSRFFLLS